MSADEAESQYRDTLDTIFSGSYAESRIVFFSTLLKRVIGEDGVDYNPTVDEYNDRIRSLATTHSHASQIVLAEMNSNNFISVDTDYSDLIHPNDEGYRKMASIWYSLIIQNEGIIPAPIENDTHDDDKDTTTTANDCTKVPGTAVGPVTVQRGSGLEDGKYVHTSVDRGIVDVGYMPEDDREFPDGIFFAQLVTSTQFRETAQDDLIYVLPGDIDTEWDYYRMVNDPTNAGSFLKPALFKPGIQCAPDRMSN
jgi:hypothetical protein